MSSASTGPTGEDLYRALREYGYERSTGLSPAPTFIETGTQIPCEVESHPAQWEIRRCDRKDGREELSYIEVTVLASPDWVVDALGRVSAARYHYKETNDYAFVLNPVLPKSMLSVFPDKSSVLHSRRRIRFKYALSHDLDLNDYPPRLSSYNESDVASGPPILIAAQSTYQSHKRLEYPSPYNWVLGSYVHADTHFDTRTVVNAIHANSNAWRDHLLSSPANPSFSIFVPAGHFDWPGALEETRKKSQERFPDAGMLSLDGSPEDWSSPIASFRQLLTVDARGISWLQGELLPNSYDLATHGHIVRLRPRPPS